MTAPDRLAERQLVVVTGKGGVGKTTLTAVLGRLLAERGRRVLLLEVDPRESLHQALGTEPSGGEFVQAGPQLWIQNLQPAAVIEELVRDKVPVAFLPGKLFDNPAFRHFVDGAPGLKETARLGHRKILQNVNRNINLRSIQSKNASNLLESQLVIAPGTQYTPAPVLPEGAQPCPPSPPRPRNSSRRKPGTAPTTTIPWMWSARKARASS